jgi:methylphosphotriester-DNA--protein-cysteine methyltransferase
MLEALACTLLSTVLRSRYTYSAPSLQHFLKSECAPSDLALIQTACEFLYDTHGQMPITELAARCGLSLRQFERRFKRLTGLSPKILARLIRFEAARDGLLRGQSWADLVYEFGYTDQAHFIHDFKAILGYTPGAFIAAAIQRSTSGFYNTPDPRPQYPRCVFE